MQLKMAAEPVFIGGSIPVVEPEELLTRFLRTVREIHSLTVFLLPLAEEICQKIADPTNIQKSLKSFRNLAVFAEQAIAAELKFEALVEIFYSAPFLTNRPEHLKTLRKQGISPDSLSTQQKFVFYLTNLIEGFIINSLSPLKTELFDLLPKNMLPADLLTKLEEGRKIFHQTLAAIDTFRKYADNGLLTAMIRYGLYPIKRL
jgi:hypothetical protein